jgi:hypothetical protein
MAYADITSVIVDPTKAYAGQRVGVNITIKNTLSYAITVMAGGAYDYGVTPWPTLSFSTVTIETINGGSSIVFLAYFTMPSVACTVHAYSYYYGSDGAYHFDDEYTKGVSLNTTAVFTNLTVTYSKA